jgi:hypothetical protein
MRYAAAQRSSGQARHPRLILHMVTPFSLQLRLDQPQAPEAVLSFSMLAPQMKVEE